MKQRIGRLRHLVALTAAVGAGGMMAACSQGDPPTPPPSPDAVVVAQKAPPPISGGTLIVAERTSKNLAVASDPDRDIVWFADLAANLVLGNVQLAPDSEPGRLVEDAHGRVHVALRKAGEIATIDLASRSLLRTTPVCAAPRGITYDDAKDLIHVACMNGELVTLAAKTDKVTRTLHLDRDLRDVIVQGDDLLVTKFRSAEAMLVGSDGSVKTTFGPPVAHSTRMRQMGKSEQFSPDVAWRTIPIPGGGAAMLHQRALDTTIVIRETGGDSYGGGGTTPGCDPTIVHTTVTTFSADAIAGGQSPVESAPAIPNAILPVDIAAHVTTGGAVEYSFVAAASNKVVTITQHALEAATGDNTDCDQGDDSTPVEGEPVALAYWGDHVVVQTRDPIAITVLGRGGSAMVLPGVDTKDTGHDMFHRNDGGSVAVVCASCHPEGRDDGHVWHFNIGVRRTQNIGNDVLTTAPLHWDGKMHDLGMIMHEVFEKRMGGLPKGPQHVSVFEGWISKLPAMANPIVGDPDAIARGKQIFDGQGGCMACHNGEKFTNNLNEDVGTGGSFQVPSLIGVAMRAPYMHTGCAKTLKDRFDPACGGKSHGNTANLSDAQIDDLVAYLETL
ncbi:MAG TPA: c-type cytochrome [Minicystis sp.]|nr:c-type cytochrome [Minicystis sp.]